MGDLIKGLKEKDVGAIGIGAMIVFIAMVLVAGIAASVLIQTSNTLEIQAMATGRDTTVEVSSGIAVEGILGFAATDSDISILAIMVRPRSGSDGIDLGETYVELSDTDNKIILVYDNSLYEKPDGLDDIFGTSTAMPSNDGPVFGILVVEDADDSFASNTQVVMNRGDKAYLCINATDIFSDIPERTDMWGMVVPEFGSPGMISFRTPASYSGENIFNLQ